MLGIIILLVLSWLVLRYTVKQPIGILGFSPPGRRLVQLAAGFALAAVLCTAVQWSEIALTQKDWEVNAAYSITQFGSVLWWNTKSVLFEELIFRGALLAVVIRLAGMRKGVLLSAAAFGIYHWFSYGVFGNLPVMAFVFLTTFAAGAAWAYAYARTGSIALASGSHLGWNAANAVLFSEGPLGKQLMTTNEGAGYTPLSGIPSLLFFIASNAVLPAVVYLIAKRYSASSSVRE
jgi:membrane protease YdiL (CAAX protease family)